LSTVIPRTLTVVVPVFNERTTLRASVERLIKSDLPLELEVIVADDGSTDGSIDTVADLVESSQITSVTHECNLGKGAALRSALGQATGDLLTVLDADLEYNPADFKGLLEPLLNGETEVSFGTRSWGAHTAYSFWYVVGNKLIAFCTNLLYNTWLTDVETCFKLATTPAWRSLKLRENRFGIEAEATAKFLRNGYRIYEVPITYRARTREEGKKLTWTAGLQAMWILVRVRLFGR
jgi:glycosyltransferase involved in cell wall biosynthesis